MLIEAVVELSSGSDLFLIKGLSDDAYEQIKERLYSAIHTNGYLFPSQGINIHLTPEDLSMDGLGHTLALAIGISTSAASGDSCGYQPGSGSCLVRWR